MKNRIEEGSWIIASPIAHRGLHGDAPENSAAAFTAAIERGFPIETDVQMTSDGELVCFHDDDMERMTGVGGFVWTKTLAEIRAMTLAGTRERIMTFAEFLRFVGGRVPLMIELKTQKKYKELTAKTIDCLKDYTGKYAIQSFDPRMVAEVRKLSPSVIRGQLLCKDRHENVNYFVDRALAHGLLNFLSKPDFININCKYLPVKKSWKKKYVILTWTIDSEEKKKIASEYADNVIFERVQI